MSGSGGMTTPGRWHSRGQLVVYLASVPSLAMLEVLVNQTTENLYRLDYHLMRVEWPAQSTDVFPLAQLPEDWNSPQRIQETASIGDHWLRQRAALALAVPSAVVPVSVETTERNYLINPLHPLWQERTVSQVTRLPFDPRFRTEN